MPASSPVFAFDLPTVGGDLNTWGGFINGNFNKIENLLYGTVGPRLRPDLDAGLWEIGGVAVTADAVEINKLDGLTALTADLNLLAGLAAAGLTGAELGFVNGLTSAVQAQLDGKQPLDTQLTQLAAPGVANTVKMSDGTNYVDARGPRITPQAVFVSTSGTQQDWTWTGVVNEIVVMFDGTTSNTTGRVTIQLLVGGVAVTTGYVPYGGSSGTTGFTMPSLTGGLPSGGMAWINRFQDAAASTWVFHSPSGSSAGTLAAAGQVDGIRIIASGTFSGGRLNVAIR